MIEIHFMQFLLLFSRIINVSEYFIQASFLCISEFQVGWWPKKKKRYITYIKFLHTTNNWQFTLSKFQDLYISTRDYFHNFCCCQKGKTIHLLPLHPLNLICTFITCNAHTCIHTHQPRTWSLSPRLLHVYFQNFTDFSRI